jgi:sphinganine-1-phosphate aldolase
MKKLPEKMAAKKEEILAKMVEMSAEDADWKNAKTWSLVYHIDNTVEELLKDSYTMFMSTNGLNPLAFPSLNKFENDVIAMTTGLLGGNKESAGSMTSGGTESILMAVKAARDWARSQKPEIAAPEMILPATIHPAFQKAGHYLGVKPITVAVGEDYKADVEAMKAAINQNTILMVGSAPCYPYGVIDPIKDLAAAAQEQNLLFHVDACLGGFLIPFLKRSGYDIPEFDLSVPGVTSISADIHKYGFASKGASTVIYKDSELRKYQFFVYMDFPGGIYASPTMTGTRPGGAIAAAWAIMNFLGEEGYIKVAQTIMKTTRQLMEGITGIESLHILGKPDMSVFAFGSDKVDVYAIGDEMQLRGWMLDRNQSPASLHMMVTPNHQKIVESFLSDLKQSTESLISKGVIEAPSGMAAMYGMMASLPDRNLAKELTLDFMDDIFRIR